MNKTIISILIWLVCMPCMVAAETSKVPQVAKVILSYDLLVIMGRY